MLDLSPAAARRALGAVADASALDDDAVRDRLARAVWSGVAEPGDRVAGVLVSRLGALAALEWALRPTQAPGDIASSDLDRARDRWLPRLTAPGLLDGLRIAAAARIRLVTPGDAGWPDQVDDLGAHAPLCLWVRGDADVLAELRPSLAMVGARASTSYGDHVAGELAADLCGRGVTIVSGAAYGIDGAAHRAALNVGGRTIALLAGGVERAYPAGNTRLIDGIAAHGAVVSEVACGSTPTKWRFLQRNRLIAALSDATVVVEAGWRSGSLNTAHHALELGRPLGAVPGPITSPASAGAHELLRNGTAQCITSADDASDLLGISAQVGGRRDDGRPPTDATTRVRDALSVRGWRDVDEVARRSGMSRDEVESLLGLLDLAGEATRSAAGWRRASTVPPAT